MSDHAHDPTAVKRSARDLGFALCGVCDARPSDHGAFFRRWLEDGKHGRMRWLAENVEVRLDPRKLLAGARSIICVADRIPAPGGERPPAAEPGPDPDERAHGQRSAAHARVARYARATDYHKVIKRRLFKLADTLRADHPDHEFRACVDTAPLMEREHAARAGIGWVGKHTLLLHRELGSHLLLGALVTTLAIEPDPPETDHCGTCRRCIDACPTDAITPYSVDARRCISYLTIEHREAIDHRLHGGMGDWLFGCDDCQTACPYVGRAARAEPPPGAPDAAGYLPLDADFDPRQVIDWTEAERRARFRGSAMKRAKLDMMRRNAIIVVANRGLLGSDPALVRRLEAIAADPEEAPMVRQTARTALARAG